MSPARVITPNDVLPYAVYAKIRDGQRAEMVAYKRDRRMAVGPNATLLFEDFRTLLAQVQEMLHIEKGGEAQLEDELAAYNPLIPQGSEIVATMLLEYEDPLIRARELAKLGGIEHCVFLEIGGDRIAATPDMDQERTTADGKTSAVHFLRFGLSPEQAERFRIADERIVIGIGHAHYGHMAVMPERVREALSKALD